MQYVLPNVVGPMNGPVKTVQVQKPKTRRDSKRVTNYSLNLIWALSYGT